MTVTGYIALSILPDPIHTHPFQLTRPLGELYLAMDPDNLRSASRQILAYLGPAGTYSHQVYLILVFTCTGSRLKPSLTGRIR